MFTQYDLREILHYDPDTGVFSSHRTRKALGWVTFQGRGAKKLPYIRLSVLGKDYYAHRLAWFYMTGAWPVNEVDHRDNNGLNNRWDNLRDATHAQNGHNQGLRSTNKSGVKGVTWDAERSRWFASITINSKTKGLGRFDEFDDAVAARRAAEEAHHGVFAHTQGNA